MWALDIIKSCGLTYDASIFPVRRRLYGVPDWPPNARKLENGLWEFPPATVRWAGQNFSVAGGGWLRMLPYGLIRRGLRSPNVSSPAVVYIHPHEVDPAGIALRHRPSRLYTRAVVALEQTGKQQNPVKIRQLLADFDFCRLDSFLPAE